MSNLDPTPEEIALELNGVAAACRTRGGKGPRTDEPRERFLWEEMARLRIVVAELARRARAADEHDDFVESLDDNGD